MDLAAHMRLDPVAQMQDLKDISDTVQDYVDRELYLSIYGNSGEYNIGDILNDCYTLVLGELEDIGIKFTRDYSELLDDWYTAKSIYCLSYVFSTAQIQTWIINEDMLSFIEEILSSEEKLIDPIQAILERVIAIHKGQMEYDALADYISEIISTDVFKDYMKNFVVWARDTDRDMITPDVARAQKYIAHIQGLRASARAAVNKIFDKFPGFRGRLDQKKIDKLLADYDLDKLSPSDIHIYSLIDGDVEIPSSLVPYKQKWMDIHHARSLHHLDYWEQHDERMTLENVILVVAHYSEPDTTIESFWGEITNDEHRFDKLMDEDMKKLFFEMAEALYPRPDKRHEEPVAEPIR